MSRGRRGDDFASRHGWQFQFITSLNQGVWGREGNLVLYLLCNQRGVKIPAWEDAWLFKLLLWYCSAAGRAKVSGGNSVQAVLEIIKRCI